MKTKGITKESFRKAFTPSEMRSIAASRKGKEKTPAFREYTDNARQHFVRGFTLIELLVVIAILAILMVAVVMALNPSELLKQARDSNRLSDLSAIKTALALYQTDVVPAPNAMGNASTSYLSLLDPTVGTTGGSCSGITGTTHCAASSTYRQSNGTGWIPVDLTKISIGSPLPVLPVDPVNTAVSGLYYTYQTDGTYWEVSANAESQKFQAQFPQSPQFTVGTSASLIAATSTSLSSFTLTYTAGSMGIITGSSPQTVTYGGSGTSVTATPNAGDVFVNWSDGSTANPRTDTDVTGNISVTANFAFPNCGTSTVTGLAPDTTVYHTVLGADNNCWLASNLGTPNIATAYNDSSAYGWYYQWGRLTDGHQIPTSATTATLSTTDVPGNADFIEAPNSPYDWRSPQNNNLWQGTSTAINNPCPTGWSIPTEMQWSTWAIDADVASCSSGCGTVIYNTTLKLTEAGSRYYPNASLNNQGSNGNYWASSVFGSTAYTLYFAANGVDPAGSNDRAYGFSARCIKD